MAPSATDQVFSSGFQEKLVLVDCHDRQIGLCDKEICHDGEGLLHRAFSVFIINDAGEILIQQRSAHKRLWPLYWSNSCCSHPRHRESIESAAKRRVQEELGFTCDVRYLYKFQYWANYLNFGSENELCSVFIGRHSGDINVDSMEIADWCFMRPEQLSEEMILNAERFTPWFRLEWQRIIASHRSELAIRD